MVRFCSYFFFVDGPRYDARADKFTHSRGDERFRVNNKAGPHNVVFDEDAIPDGVDQEKISMDDQLGEPGDTFEMSFNQDTWHPKPTNARMVWQRSRMVYPFLELALHFQLEGCELVRLQLLLHLSSYLLKGGESQL